MQESKNKSGIVAGILLPLGLVCLFAFCSLALALLGGRAYKQIQTGVEKGFGPSVTSGYLTTKLSQFNHSGSVSLRQEGDVSLLIIESEAAGAVFETRIYMLDGVLMENFEKKDAQFVPAGGIRIAQLKDCRFALDDDGLFTATIESLDGAVTKACFAVAQGGAL